MSVGTMFSRHTPDQCGANRCAHHTPLEIKSGAFLTNEHIAAMDRIKDAVVMRRTEKGLHNKTGRMPRTSWAQHLSIVEMNCPYALRRRLSDSTSPRRAQRPRLESPPTLAAPVSPTSAKSSSDLSSAPSSPSPLLGSLPRTAYNRPRGNNFKNVSHAVVHSCNLQYPG